MILSLNFIIKKFDELDRVELYEILRLRETVFIVEQQCVYHDIDDRDPYAFHLMAKSGNEIIGYARYFSPGVYFKEAAIGRVLMAQNFRKLGYAHQLIEVAIKTIKDDFSNAAIKISAQQYLTKFYESHGFEQVGEGYLEDDIPHIAMLRT